MAINCLYLSGFSTAVGLVALQWWMASSLDGMEADGLIGSDGRSGSSENTGELLLSSHMTVALLLNFVINVYILVVLLLKTLFFVQLNASESRKVLERFINYIIYKSFCDRICASITIFSYFLWFVPEKDYATYLGCATLLRGLNLALKKNVMGTFLPLVVPPNISHVVVWSTWLIFLCSLKIFQSLARDRLERLNASPSVTPLKYFRVYSTLLLVILADFLWMKLCITICGSYSSSLLMLLFFEPFSIAFDTLQAIMVHGFQLIEIYQRNSDGNVADYLDSDLLKTGGSLSEWRGILVRHCGFVLDMLTLLMALGHYLMTWWLHGMAFHLVDVVLFLNLRALVCAIAKRIRTYIKLRKALSSLDGALPDATCEELCSFNDECAICRGPMARAKKLSCNHLFHLVCLRSWLDQGLTEVYSCPTCRRPLFVPSAQGDARSAPGNGIGDQQLAEHLNLGLNQQRIPGNGLPSGASPNQQQNTTDVTWRGATFDSGLTPPWANQGMDGASTSSSVRSVGFGGVQMMMRQLASVSENFAHGSLDDTAWNLWPSQHNSAPIPSASGLRIRGNIHSVNNSMSELVAMVDRVREVLPHIPDELIVQDLLRTNNINITVNNLLVQ